MRTSRGLMTTCDVDSCLIDGGQLGREVTGEVEDVFLAVARGVLRRRGERWGDDGVPGLFEVLLRHSCR